MMAEQPLSLQALNEAVSISMGIDAQFGGSNTTSMIDFLILCAGIITIEEQPAAGQSSGEKENSDPSNAKVWVVHASASEYFYTRRGLYFPSSHETVTLTCAHAIKTLAIEPYWGEIGLSGELAEA
jgi:hypothetical protein